MGNTPQQHQDHDDKKNPSQDQKSGQGMPQQPQKKPDDKGNKPTDDKRGQTDRRDAQR